MNDIIHDLKVEIECLKDNLQDNAGAWDNLKSWIKETFSEDIPEIEMVLDKMEHIEQGVGDD